MLRSLGAIVGAAGALSLIQCTSGMRTGEDVIRVMHDQYADVWYSTVRLRQTNTNYLPDDTKQFTVWTESMSLPGKLRIDVHPEADATGRLYVGDSQYVFDGGDRTATIPGHHPILPLAFDVYVQPVEQTLATLRSLGFGLESLREDTWEGRPTYVIGAAAGDLESPQFWIDQERLVLTRMILPRQRDGSPGAEVRIGNYETHGNAWMSTEIDIVVGGKLVMHGVYDNIEIDIPLDPTIFDPDQWATAVRP